MPMKFGKSFPRRKSSGNALEEITNPPQRPESSSFRVIPRDEVKKGSIDAGKPDRLSGIHTFSSPLHKGRQQSFEDDSGASHRYYDSYSSSARGSSSSTLPSSAEPDNPDELFSRKGATGHKPWQSDNHTFSLRNATRALTFNNRGNRESASFQRRNTLSESDEFANTNNVARSRATTASSYASTATPPKLDHELSLGTGDFGSEFSNMFSSLDKDSRRKSAIMEETETTTPPPPALTKSGSEPLPPTAARTFGQGRGPYTPSPIRVDRAQDIEASPYSWDSRDSNDRLMASPRLNASPQEEKAPPVPRHGTNTYSGTPLSAPAPVASAERPRYGTPRVPGQQRRSSSDFEDEDAQIVANSARLSRAERENVRPNPVGLAGRIRDEERATNQKATIGSFSSDTSYNTQSGSSAGSSLRAPANDPQNLFNATKQTTPTASFNGDNASNDVTPRAKQPEPREEEDSLFDQATVANATAAMLFTENKQSQAQQTQKVMTKAEFDQYRVQQESRTDVSDSESEASDDYEDESETERNRKLVKQRDKQAQQLAVFRQKMRKTTGEPTPNPDPAQFHPSFSGSLSTPDLTLGISKPSTEDSRGGASDGEDEDVPLGILQAHGFPNKNRPPPERPPTQMSYSASSVNLLQPSMQRPGSAAGSTAGMPRGPLPPFARNLPVDPYFGASLVNPVNREPLTYGRAGPASVYGGEAPPMPGAGSLISVIADEERAKKMRRGSPNTRNMYGSAVSNPFTNRQQFAAPPMPPMNQFGMPMGQMGGMGGMGGYNMASMQMPQAQGADQAALNQQFIQMMNMSMQMMTMQQQQMMQQQGLQQPTPQPGGQQMMSGQQNSFLAPPNPGQIPRPMSMASNTPSMPQQQRSMSMVNPPNWNQPSMGGYAPSVQGLSLNPHAGYAPSLAPSERSNVGMARRYRPVAAHLADATSTVTSSATVQPATPQPGLSQPTEKKKGGVLAMLRPKSRPQADGPADDDDDEGWGNMKAKKNKWRDHKSSNSAPALNDYLVPNV